jgi:hypothetical protein
MKRTLTFLFICTALPALGNEMNGVENISIYGQTPLSTNDLAEESTFGSVQTINEQSLAQSQAISLAEHMKNKLTSLHINDIQNNPFSA